MRDEELLHRLAEANPVPEPRRLSAGDRETARLTLEGIVATSPEARPQRSRRRGRRRRLGLAASLCAAAASIVVVAALPLGGPAGAQIAGRAHAALSAPRSILHYRAVQSDVFGAPVQSRGDEPPLVTESWRTSDGRYSRWRSYDQRGRIDWEVASGPTERRFYSSDKPAEIEVQRVDPTLGEPPRPASGPEAFDQDYAAALRAGLEDRMGVSLEGEADLRGRAAYRLRFEQRREGARTDPFGQRPATVTLFLDRETYLPIEERREYHDRGVVEQEGGITPFSPISSTVRYPVFERLPRTARTERLLEMTPRPGARVVRVPGALLR